MSTKLSVFIGRFQPPHKAHIDIIHRALLESDRVLVLIGSSFKAPDIRNPYTHDMREKMIRACFSMGESSRISVDFLCDNPYNELSWIKNVQRAVNSCYDRNFGWVDKPDITLIGHHKDKSSYYLDLFPSWKQKEIPNQYGVDSTFVRENLFRGDQYWSAEGQKKISHMIPEPVMELINIHRTTSWTYTNLVRETGFIRSYKQQWASSPYPPTFHTADAITTCLGHVLLVTRKSAPGEGLFAIPGGFVNQYERVKDCAVRELEEETKIKVPTKVLFGSIKKEKLYDHPGRSLRGRTITMAYHIDLADVKLPKVKGSDDATTAKWFPLHEFIQMESMMYEDHFYIITDMLELG